MSARKPRTEDLGAGLARTTLDSGLRIVTERMPSVRSLAIGFWVDVGSRDEVEHLAGATHFLEHLLFKGTDTRTAQEIAEAVEAVGGEMNAFTAHEYTAYYLRVVDDCLDLALDILSDIVWAPAFREADIESERQVILEEIRMRDDTPDDLVHDVFGRALFPDSPVGREVIGYPETIEAMTRDDIAVYHADHYPAGNVVVAVAGNVDHEVVVDGVEARFAGRSGPLERSRQAAEAPPQPLEVWTKPAEQAHLVLGARALRRDDPDRYALTVVNQALGGGMASRLFQEIREKRGLAYSVYSYRHGYEDTGVLAAYAGTAPKQAVEVVELMHEQFDALLSEGLTDEEMERAKGALKGSMALSLESPGALMNRLGRNEITLGEVPTVDEMIRRIDAVTRDDATRVIEQVFGGPRTLAAVGPFDADTFAPVSAA